MSWDNKYREFYTGEDKNDNIWHAYDTLIKEVDNQVDVTWPEKLRKDLSAKLSDQDARILISAMFFVLSAVVATEISVEGDVPKLAELLSYAFPCTAGIVAGCGLFMKREREKGFTLHQYYSCFLGFWHLKYSSNILL